MFQIFKDAWNVLKIDNVIQGGVAERMQDAKNNLFKHTYSDTLAQVDAFGLEEDKNKLAKLDHQAIVQDISCNIATSYGWIIFKKGTKSFTQDCPRPDYSDFI